MIQKQIKYINNYSYNLFDGKVNNKIINIISKCNLEKNTFITDIVGFYCYKKTNEYSEKNLNGFDDILIFRCHDQKYDKYLKKSLNVNLGSLIAQSSDKNL